MTTNETSGYRAVGLWEAVERLTASPMPTHILFHARPDGDAVCSSFALAHWLRSMGIPARCICADPVPDRLRAFAADPRESTAPGLPPTDLERTRVVTVDTASPSQLGALYARYAGHITLMIDHHGAGEPFADHLIVPEAAACGEVIHDLIRASGIPAPARCYDLLYAAVSSDTGCFRYANVTRATYLHAADLLSAGAHAAEINQYLFGTKSRKQLAAEHEGYERLHFYAGGRIAILPFPYVLKCGMGLENDHLGTLVEVARGVEGVEIAASIYQPTAEPVYRLSMRASVDFDVSAICAVFGGGGHRRAAGASIEARDIDTAERMVLDALRQAGAY